MFIPDTEYCFDITEIDFATGETKIRFCDYYDDSENPPICKLKNVEMEDAVKICSELDFEK